MWKKDPHSVILVLFLNSKDKKKKKIHSFRHIVAIYKEEKGTGFRLLMYNAMGKYFRTLR